MVHELIRQNQLGIANRYNYKADLMDYRQLTEVT
jgi:hypothetical protein